jgi:hypothetical protein
LLLERRRWKGLRRCNHLRHWILHKRSNETSMQPLLQWRLLWVPEVSVQSKEETVMVRDMMKSYVTTNPVQVAMVWTIPERDA